MGVRVDGTKELIAITEGLRKSAAAAVHAQGRGAAGAAFAFVVAGMREAADFVLAAFDVVGDRGGAPGAAWSGFSFLGMVCLR
ncbi:hypothetical protein OIE43_00305 [Streptomyces pseudovenezuelae]|uniref:hypothetical protein n=1 Tax=Streptomyces pseudovenezuelae TaxID=67350 RepID=UPI002E373822|nr:hypothetical protein [Streptomyces pseudovenezuelae]